MDFVQICFTVLQKLIKSTESDPEVREYGVPHHNLGRVVFGLSSGNGAEYEQTTRPAATETAASTLTQLGLIESRGPFGGGRLANHTVTPIWQAICRTEIQADHAALLRIVNRLGVKECDDHAVLKSVSRRQILADVEWAGNEALFLGMAKELPRAGWLIDACVFSFISFCPTYQGLVWQTRVRLTADSARIDVLVEEGETSTVDLKRELGLEIDSQKAELIKDVIAFANSRGTGGRYIVIGFEKNGNFCDPPEEEARAERVRLLN